VRIFVEELEIILHGLANVFVDDLRILPSPFRIQVSVADHIKRGLLVKSGLLFVCAFPVLKNKKRRQASWIVIKIARKRRIVTLQRSNVQASGFTISGFAAVRKQDSMMAPCMV
jgi:hypothetical protein